MKKVYRVEMINSETQEPRTRFIRIDQHECNKKAIAGIRARQVCNIEDDIDVEDVNVWKVVGVHDTNATRQGR